MARDDLSPTSVATRRRGGPNHPSQLFDADREVVDYERSAVDLVRLVVFGTAAAIVVVTTHFLRDGIGGLEADISELLTTPVGWLRAAVDLLLIATVLIAGVSVLVIPLVTRRLRLLGYVAAAMVLTGGLFSLIDEWVGLRVVQLGPEPTTEALARTFALDVSATAQLAAAFITIGPFVDQRWRRTGAGIIAAVLVMQLVVVSGEPTHALLIVTIGPTVGCAVLLALGRPTTRPRPSSVLAALRRYGLVATDLVATEDGSLGTETFTAQLDEGDHDDGTARTGPGLFLKVLGSNRLAADQIVRSYRAVRMRDSAAERPFTSVRRTVEHEALVSYEATAAGIRTPALRCLAPAGQDSFLLAYDRLEGSTLDVLAGPGGTDPGRVTDEVLRDIWTQVARLRERHLAHRRLQPDNLVLDGEGHVWIVGLGRATVAAPDTLLRNDLAQLLTALAVLVGVERSVASAVDVLGPAAVATSLGRIQPAALPTTTRAAVNSQPGLLDRLRSEVERQCGVEEAPLEPITRLGARQLVTLVMVVGVIYFLVPQFADLPAIVEQVRDADWIWAIPALLASAASYPTAAMAITGSTPGRLPFASTTATQLASSFTSTVTPAGLGGMALNVRFLQRQGVDAAVATSAVGLDAVGGIVGHVALIGIFLVWAGRDALGDVELPSPRALLIGFGVVVAIAVLTLLVPAVRKMVRTRLFPILARSAQGLRDVLTTPSKVTLMLAGSVLVTMTYLLAFVASAEAFDIHIRFATLGAVYLIGAALATIAPTPGGLGATEAALIGGLVAVGVSNSQALPAVFFFRLVTFWIPILPGWIAFTWLSRTNRI